MTKSSAVLPPWEPWQMQAEELQHWLGQAIRRGGAARVVETVERLHGTFARRFYAIDGPVLVADVLDGRDGAWVNEVGGERYDADWIARIRRAPHLDERLPEFVNGLRDAARPQLRVERHVLVRPGRVAQMACVLRAVTDSTAR